MYWFIFSGLIVISFLNMPLNAAETMTADGWRFVTVRPETAAKPAVQQENGTIGLVIAGNANPISDGRWVKRTSLPQSTYVQVDGGVGPENIRALLDAGATLFVAATAIFGREDLPRAFRRLVQALA